MQSSSSLRTSSSVPSGKAMPKLSRMISRTSSTCSALRPISVSSAAVRTSVFSSTPYSSRISFTIQRNMFIQFLTSSTALAIGAHSFCNFRRSGRPGRSMPKRGPTQLRRESSRLLLTNWMEGINFPFTPPRGGVTDLRDVGGAPGMKITAVDTIQCAELANLVWLRLHSDEGLVGLGETMRNPEAVVAYIHETCAPYLLGRDPRQIDRHHDP